MKEKVTNKITDFGLIFIASMAIPYNIITFFALQDSEYQTVRFIPPILALAIILLAIFRKKINLKIKVRIFLVILLLAGTFCLLLGLLDTASLWFVLAIIYTLFTGEKKTALYLFIVSFISILTIGILMITKNPYIPFDYGFEDCQFACVAIRIFDFLVIGFLIYYIIKEFKATIHSYIHELSEKAKILERLNLSLENSINQKTKNKLLKKNLELNNKKLVINTLHLLNQTEFDNHLITELKKIAKNSNLINKKKLKQLIQTAKINNNSNIWEEFERSFITINTSFYENLYEKFPNLTKNEKKLCAFIKLNMNTKDIALLLNISNRGVETARYRLRKNMQLAQNKNLLQFLQEV